MPQHSSRICRWLALVVLLLVAARGATADDETTEAEANFDHSKVLEFSPERLAAEAVEKAPPLGPLTTFKPKGWLTSIGNALNSPIRIFPERTQDNKVPLFPTITVLRSPPADGQPKFKDPDVTDKNVAEYVEFVAKSVEVKSQLERVEPLLIGKRYFARYVTKYKPTNSRRELEKQVLKTVMGGEEITVELVVESEKSLLKYRNKSYAVAANLTLAK